MGVRPNSPPQRISVSSNRPQLLEVGEQGADRLVALAGELGVVDFDVVVVVPRLALAVPDLHEPHAALDQPAGDQNLPGLRAVAVGFEHVLGLAADVEGLGRFALHAVGQLEAVDAGVEGRVVAALLFVLLVEGGERVELPPLGVGRQPLVADVLDQLVDLGVLRVDVGALVDAGQKRRLPVLRFLRSGSRRGTWR